MRWIRREVSLVGWMGVALAFVLSAGACRREDGGETQARALAAADAQVRGEGVLPEIARLETFSLRSQADTEVTLSTFEGKVWVAAFMFTRCPTVCPEITRRMKRVQDRAKEQALELRLVSFSVDPEHDTPEVLTRYAGEYGADLRSWTFLTGDYETIARTAEQGFKMGLSGRADPTAEHMGITHGSHLVLVDRQGVIRGYYRTKEDAELDRLLTDAKRL